MRGEAPERQGSGIADSGRGEILDGNGEILILVMAGSDKILFFFFFLFPVTKFLAKFCVEIFVLVGAYRSIQIDYKQRFFLGGINFDYRYRIALPEELISITETDLWEFQQKISHYRYRFSLEFQLIATTDTDFGLKTN